MVQLTKLLNLSENKKGGILAGRRLNRQVRNYEKCLKNSLLGVEKLSFFRGLAFSFF